MSHTAEASPTSVTVAPGGSAQFNVIVGNAPDPSVPVSIAVTYGGETVTAPVTVNTTGSPTVAIDAGTSGLTFDVGEPTRSQSGTQWVIPITVSAPAA